MNGEHAGHLKAVLQAPYEDPPRLEYARHLKSRDAIRSDFIVTQLRLAQDPASPATEDLTPYRSLSERIAAEQHERKLRESFGPYWAKPLVNMGVREYEWSRGFIAGVTLPATLFLTHADQIFAEAPIVFVRLTLVKQAAAALFRSPALRKVRALSLSNVDLGDEEIRLLAQSEHLSNLWWLDLGFNRIGWSGVQSLAISERLPRLEFVSFNRNPADPRDTVGVEGTSIVDVQRTPEGRDLESAATRGSLPWLHRHTLSTLHYPPDPYGPPPSSLENPAYARARKDEALVST